jgi:hypothetical protein
MTSNDNLFCLLPFAFCLLPKILNLNKKVNHQ